MIIDQLEDLLLCSRRLGSLLVTNALPSYAFTMQQVTASFQLANKS